MSENFCEIVGFVLESEKYFLIWCSPDEGDDYFENYSSRVVAFRDKKSADDYLLSKNRKADKCTTVFDFDALDFSDCSDFLDKWNIIDDFAKSVSRDFIGNGDDFTPLYSKFVRGSNLPALNTSGKIYTPAFVAEELEQIESVKRDMLNVLKSVLSNAVFAFHYDFALIKDFLSEYGVKVEVEENVLSAFLADDICMRFYNAEDPIDVRCAFCSDWDWHCHGDFYFFDENGIGIQLGYLDFLEELVDGNILICFEYRNGKLFEIRPAHIKYFDKSDFEYLENGEEIRIRRLKFEKRKTDKTEAERR
ncbi:MAG: hypothetical protein IKP49_10915 [Treponema sp.]|nr:hypothetical protein [Treponema sp.]